MYDEKRVLDAILKSKSPVTLQELVRQFRIKGNERREFRQLLKDLEHRGKISKVSGKNYAPPSGKSSSIIGRLEVTSRGFGFVRPDWTNLPERAPFEGDLYVSPRDMRNALDGDLVRAEVLRKGAEGVSGRVEEVIEHAHKKIVGRYRQKNAREGEVTPRSSRIDRRVVVNTPPKGMGVNDYDWVEVSLLEYPDPPTPLLGEVTGRLGADEDRGIDVLLVIRDRGIIEEFPLSVQQDVEKLDFDWKKDLKNRVDYRKLPTITIDPKTAKDFDDALSIEPHPDGGWRLYVHIADVAHFVKKGSALDHEAQERSTSVYPVDRVVPMLPEQLSNYLCSLVPHEDRLSVTAVMHINTRGAIVSSEFHSSVIHSDFRFSYEQVQEFFDHEDNKEGAPKAAHFSEFKALFPVLRDCRKIAKTLRKTRMDRGALDLDIPQATVIFDDEGKVSDLKFYPRYESHQLVEECMLIANEAVAQFLTKKEAPLLYRVHEVADEDRLEKLAPVMASFGIRLGGKKGGITPKDLQAALDKAQALPAGHIVRRLILRALKRAEYDPVNVGHFGLASENYCHFTSPIRRYPDVVVHRQIKSIEGKKGLAYRPDDDELDSLGAHTSSRERRAQQAEWEAIAIKSLEFIKRFEGEEMTAYIASVQNFGLFLELEEYPVEGFIRKQALKADRFELDDTGVMLVGRSTGIRYKLADKVKVRLDKVDPIAQQMDLTLVEEESKLVGRRAKLKPGPTPFRKFQKKRRGKR